MMRNCEKMSTRLPFSRSRGKSLSSSTSLPDALTNRRDMDCGVKSAPPLRASFSRCSSAPLSRYGCRQHLRSSMATLLREAPRVVPPPLPAALRESHPAFFS